mgnify:CR=1 FL=1
MQNLLSWFIKYFKNYQGNKKIVSRYFKYVFKELNDQNEVEDQSDE